VASWYTWLAQNRTIFDGQPVVWNRVEASIIAAYHELPDPPPTRPRNIQPMPNIDRTIPWAFFDGAANQTGCGGGFVLHINEHHRYLAKMGLGIGSNNYAQLSAIRNLLQFALTHHITDINIYGDSMLVVNWINNATECHSYTLSNILQDALTLKAAFNHFTCVHIYKEHNCAVDQLSKAASLLPRGEWLMVEHNDEEEHRFYHRPYIDQRDQRDISPEN